MYENSKETAAAEVYETGPPKRAASLSRSSLVTMTSSSSRSNNSFSIEDNELPEQLHFVHLMIVRIVGLLRVPYHSQDLAHIRHRLHL
jgi:hypothetical protein